MHNLQICGSFCYCIYFLRRISPLVKQFSELSSQNCKAERTCLHHRNFVSGLVRQGTILGTGYITSILPWKKRLFRGKCCLRLGSVIKFCFGLLSPKKIDVINGGSPIDEK